jgi:hypothetical protein
MPVETWRNEKKEKSEHEDEHKEDYESARYKENCEYEWEEE